CPATRSPEPYSMSPCRSRPVCPSAFRGLLQLLKHLLRVGAPQGLADVLLDRTVDRGPLRIGHRVELGLRQRLDERLELFVVGQLVAGRLGGGQEALGGDELAVVLLLIEEGEELLQRLLGTCAVVERSEERRVGKGCSRRAAR